MSTKSKNIPYLGRDFDSLKAGLIEFAKTYYPNTYNDFNEASPGMMFVEMAAYVGDVLNYYVDAQLKESLLLHASERRSVLSIANALGYKPKLSTAAEVEVDIFQLLPVSGSGIGAAPDPLYSLKVNPGMRVRSTVGSVEFIVREGVDFSNNTIQDPTEITVYSVDNTGAPNYYLAKKTRKAISAERRTQQVVVSGTKKFYKFKIPDTTVIGIESIVDSNGNSWYEVPYLAQDTVFEQVTNTAFNDPDAAVYSQETPYLLKLKKVPRRFITRVLEDGLEVQFGAGISSAPDEELLPLPENFGLTLPTGIQNLDISVDPQSPVFTGAYGVAPSNTTLTVTYLVGGGIEANVPSNTITEIVEVATDTSSFPISTPQLNAIINGSIAVNNRFAAAGGRSVEPIEEIRQNALAQFASQNRAVTREDYIVRAYAMPNTFGSVSKVYITPDEQANLATSEVNDTVVNPLALNMYVLSYNNSRQLTQTNRAIKENLKTYLSQYRMLTDSINIRDAFIVNIGFEFDVVILPNYNVNEVLARCVNELKSFFDIDKWQINQPIVYAEIAAILNDVEGVQSVTGMKITNLYDPTAGYSNIAYNIQEATRNGIVYPSIDPCIFEIKYPNSDIKGRSVGY